ncbi:MAG: glycosyltransferase, partial [Cyanobacteria bacterium P01_H01_bin.130]
MDISVIIPVYNGAATIAETLESIFSQTLDGSQAEVEIIIINDGSTDQTNAIVETFMGRRKDYPIHLFEVENGGVSRARNRGAQLAKGRYLTFIDADDLWTTDKLEAQFFALESNPKAGFVYSWVNSIDLEGNFLRRGGYPTITGDPWVQLLIIDVVESGSNVMVRRDAYEQVHGFDEKLTHSEDWDLWIRLAEHFPVVTVPMAQILYRQGGQTASTNVRKMEAGSLEIIGRAAKRVGGTGHPVIRQSLAN